MKTFELTKSLKGNFIAIDHHAKPTKTVCVYNIFGTLIDGAASLQAFEGVRFFQGSQDVKGETMGEAVENYINNTVKIEAQKQEKLALENYGWYEVELQVVKIEGGRYPISIEVQAINSEDAKRVACEKYWENPKWDTIQVIA